MDIRPSQPKQRVGLDNKALRGRLRTPRRTVIYDRPHVAVDVRKDVSSKSPTPDTSTEQTRKSVAQLDNSPIKTLEQHAKHLYEPKKRPDLPRQSRSNVLVRQSVKTASKKYRPKHRRPLMPMLFSALAVLLLVVGLAAFFSSLKADRNVKAQVSQSTKTNPDEGITDGLPSEDNPSSNIEDYSVTSDLPRFLSIERFDVQARVRRLGVSADNQLKAPANIFDVGWYEGSAKPGESGTVVINGHVSGPTKRGVFHNAGSLKAGDKIKLERGDGQIFTYSVVTTEVFDNDKVDMGKLLTSSVPGKPALNLITCTGRFNVRTNQFEPRVVVFAVQD